jgi:putative ABC transport system permease protein
MFKTFLKIAGRHLWRIRLYACINIIGLSLGTMCVVLAALYVTDELSFDHFHQRNPHLYRITSTFRDDGKVTTSGGTGQVQGPAFKAQVPEVLQYARLMGGDIYGDVRHESKAFKLQLLFVDSTFFDIFSFKLLRGDAATALNNVNSVVITERTARRFFNRIDVTGEVLQMDADPSAMRIGKPLVITGVVADPPLNSSIQFDILFPFSFMKVSFDDTNWLNAYLGTFVVLHPLADVSNVIDKFNRIAASMSRDQLAADRNASPITYGLQRVTDIHFNPQEIPNQNGESGVVNGSKPVYSYIFLGIAVFILLMASINFINISIACSMKRAKEVGIRKATGSSSTQILTQFIGESALSVLAAMLLALLLTWALLPVFNQLSEKHISPLQMLAPELVAWFAGIFIVNLVVSAVYPAYLLSALNPVQTLYGGNLPAAKNLTGKTLIVFQFSIAIVLGIASLVFYLQMHFIRSRDLGYDPTQVIRIGIQGVRDARQIKEQFTSELAGDQSIGDISLAGEFGRRETTVNSHKFMSYFRTVDEHYVPMLAMQVRDGRNFSPLFASDKKYGVLVNQAFVKEAGLKDPIGKKLMPDSYFGTEGLTITGVIRDFHYGSLKERIHPLVMPMSTQYGGDALWIKIKKDQQEHTIAKLERTFKKIVPGAVFDYSFLDESNAKAYALEQRWQKIIGYVTVLSIIICGLGLFGLTHLSILHRRRETGIRLVLGASAFEIASGFSADFIRIILIALLIACPVSSYFLHLWLNDFAYRTEIPWWVFALTGGTALAGALATVFVQGLRAAGVNPVISLRSE